MPSRDNVNIRVVIILILLWGVWSLRLGKPFYGEQDAFRTWIPAATRNYEVYNYRDIGLLVVRDLYEINHTDELNRYTHHPPLVAWLPATLALVAGHNEVSMRFVFLAAIMIASSGFYAMVKRLYDADVAFWALVLFGIPPMISYFQPTYGHDPLGFMALMLFGLVTLDWLKKPTSIRFIVLILLTIYACLSAWPAVIFIGMIGIFALLVGNWRHRIGVIILGIVSVITVVTMLLLYEYWWSGSIASLLDAYVWRSSNVSFQRGSEPFTIIEFIQTNLLHVLYFGTLGILVLAVIGIPIMWKHGTRYSNAFTAILLLAALTYMLAFRNATYIHTYYKAFLMPSLSIAAAVTIVYSRKMNSRFLRPVVDALILTTIVQALWVLSSLIATTHEPSLTNVIDYINTQPDDQEIVVTFIGINTGSENAIEYYTERNIIWNTPLQDINSDAPLTYIFCDETQDYVNNFFDDNAPMALQIDNTCAVYQLNADT